MIISSLLINIYLFIGAYYFVNLISGSMQLHCNNRDGNEIDFTEHKNLYLIFIILFSICWPYLVYIYYYRDN